MVTNSGIAFDLVEPREELITVHDIAWHLSNIARYNGATRNYTVAQHSVLVSEILERYGADPAFIFQGLMHDAAEAYIGDIISPVKYLPEVAQGLKEIEARIWKPIASKFHMAEKLHPAVVNADLRLLMTERYWLIQNNPAPWNLDSHGYVKYDDVVVVPWGSHEFAYYKFTERFKDLQARLGLAFI